MRNALIFFGTLRDSDVSWIIGTGRKVEFAAGTRLVEEDVAPGAVFLILDGKFGVTLRGKTIASLAPGELAGESSFLDGGLSPVTVTAKERSHVLAIDGERLASRLDRDEGFAARVYRAFAVTVADRLREELVIAAGGADAAAVDSDGTTEISMDVLDRSTIAANHFAEILRRTGSL